ncbi:hypothetical protein PDE_02005 [Penicillium oxalicum 114-2]|uniref:Uncharacterized protein n=1 Tax=Penicillium oxalicum (strain 114-2 / CGMCC 5302) TaxID=933388 RepID=S7ZA24_PENO1|nr:hypothetical protein PDE_02005 [Penicillium oxalicum 114-2]
MTLPDDNQIHGVDDAEVGITDLSNGPGYPWSSQAADPQDQHVRNFTPVSHSADLVTGPSQSSETVGYVPSRQEQTRNVYAPAASFSGYLGILPPGIIQIQPRLPSLTDLGFSRASSENANVPYSGPSHRAMNDHSATSHFSLTGPSSLLPTNYRNEHRVSTIFTPICEFSQPCRMGPSPDGVHFRKVVSHLFGRNKASTKLFPESVWIFYCRKHYQRARYRAEQWPFNQCELLLQSLDRMERWGYVRSFELRLRRREAMRTDGQADRPGPSGLLGSGRRHPTAFTAPSHTPQNQPEKDEMAPTRVLASGRRRPIALIAPVPEWLQREVGINKIFDDIRHLVGQIREYLSNFREYETRLKQAQGVSDARLSASPYHERRTTAVRFPDIEILPTFYPSAIEHPQRRSSQEHGHGGSFTTCNERPAIVDGDSAPAAQPHRQRNSRAGGEPRVSTRGAIKKPRDQGADGRT